MNEKLLFLLNHDYAEEFFAQFGRYPRYAPTSGDYFAGRMWARYYAGDQ